jgi:hypothetical protein
MKCASSRARKTSRLERIMKGRRLNQPILQHRQLHRMRLPGDQNAEVS